MLQISKPAKGDPFFNTAAAGGISTCIVPTPHEDGLNTLPNCVAAAWGCFNKQFCTDLKKPIAKYLQYPPDGGRKWILRAQQAGLIVSNTPAAGAVAVWGNADNLDKGHVAFVYQVGKDGEIYTSESEWKGRAWVNRTYMKPYKYGTKSFLGFILPPPQIKPTLKEGSKGTDVRELQKILAGLGYLRKDDIDGDFGKRTKGAVCCYQLENGLEVDGICGPKTWRKIEGGK